jgi:hypothetical protein
MSSSGKSAQYRNFRWSMFALSLVAATPVACVGDPDCLETKTCTKDPPSTGGVGAGLGGNFSIPGRGGAGGSASGGAAAGSGGDGGDDGDADMPGSSGSSGDSSAPGTGVSIGGQPASGNTGGESDVDLGNAGRGDAGGSAGASGGTAGANVSGCGWRGTPEKQRRCVRRGHGVFERSLRLGGCLLRRRVRRTVRVLPERGQSRDLRGRDDAEGSLRGDRHPLRWRLQRNGAYELRLPLNSDGVRRPVLHGGRRARRIEVQRRRAVRGAEPDDVCLRVRRHELRALQAETQLESTRQPGLRRWVDLVERRHARELQLE